MSCCINSTTSLGIDSRFVFRLWVLGTVSLRTDDNAEAFRSRDGPLSLQKDPSQGHIPPRRRTTRVLHSSGFYFHVVLCPIHGRPTRSHRRIFGNLFNLPRPFHNGEKSRNIWCHSSVRLTPSNLVDVRLLCTSFSGALIQSFSNPHCILHLVQWLFDSVVFSTSDCVL
jgi:hypothetical protein